MSREQLPGRCKYCPLPGQPIAKGKGTGDSPLVLGEAPGAQEAARGEPFVGYSGKLLRTVLTAAGVDVEEECYFTNSILCRPAQNKTPDIYTVQNCSERLEKEIELVQPTKILTVGSVALTSVMRAAKPLPITKWRGRGLWTRWNGRRIYTVPTYHPAAILRDAELFRDFANDIQKWVEHKRPMKEPLIEEIFCETEKQTLTALKKLVRAGSHGVISCDLETTGKDPYGSKTMTIGLGTAYNWDRPLGLGPDPDGLAVIIPIRLLRSPAIRQSLRAILLNESWDGVLGFQNIKFDLKFLDYEYEEFLRPKYVTDSMLMSYALDERPIGRFQAHGLKAQARIRYDAPDYDFNFDEYFKKSEEEQEAELPTLYHYQSQDVFYTARICHELMAEVLAESKKLPRVVNDLLVKGSIAFAEIEMRGVQLDIPYLHKLRRKFERQVSQQLEYLQEIAARDGFDNFNPLSSQQVTKLLFFTWHLPKPYRMTTDRKELHDMIPKVKDPEKQEFVRRLIEFRLDTKTLQTYVNGLLDRAQSDGRIRSNFQLVGTVTGRLASQNPNIQNIPGRHGATIRNAFIATPGHTFIEADYSQLEVRVAAALSNEEVWVEAFKTGRDLHRMVAAQMLRKEEKDVTEFERRIAKTVDFGILYGRGAKSLMEGQELKHLPEGTTWWNYEEAVKFQKEFLEQFPKLAAWMDNTKREAVRKHYVEAPSGRRRRFPFVDRNLHEILRQAGNMPIQSTASDICLTALIRLHDELPEGAYVLFSVHDAIYLECETKLLDRVTKQVKKTMIDVVPEILQIKTEVPFDVKITTGERWADEAAG